MSYIGKIKTPDNTTYLIGSTLYGTCSTAAGTAAKVVTLSDFNALTTGITIHIKFTYSNTASSPTLNVNNTGAKNIKVHGATGVGNTPYKSWFPGEIISFTYDGTNWCVNDYKDDSNIIFEKSEDDEREIVITDDGIITEDNEPYNYRQSAGGDTELDELIGGTVAWNQLVGINTTEVISTSGHKILAYIGGTWAMSVSDGTAISVTGGTDMFFDLTLMFGSTIADYVYSLEKSTAGSGIAWLKERFPKLFDDGYKAYNAGELVSVRTSAHVMKDSNNEIIGSYPLSPVELRGLFKLDASNKLYCDGDSYRCDGRVKRRYGIVDLGTLNWTYTESGSALAPYFYTNSRQLPQGNIKFSGSWVSVVYPLKCAKYISVTRTPSYFVDKCITVDGSIASELITQIQVKDTSYTNATAFKAAMSGVYLIYELATPYIEETSPFEKNQAVDAGGTEEYIDDRSVSVPVGHSTKYYRGLYLNKKTNWTNVIKPPGGNLIYSVRGTQTSATASWTGNIEVPELYDGLSINYYLPYAGVSGTNVTLNLTLSDGTTTGAKNCYITTGRLTTQYGAGRTIMMTYYSAGSIKISGTPTTDDRWICDAYYDTNDGAYYDRVFYVYMKAGPGKVYPCTIICQLPDGRWESVVTSSTTNTSKTKNTHGFLFKQIRFMYANQTYSENARIDNSNVFLRHTSISDTRYSFNTANNATYGLTTQKPVYLVGTIGTDGLFYLADTWWTQILPSTEDGKIYIELGEAYDYYRFAQFNVGEAFVYTNGHLRQFSQDAATVNGHTVQKDVPSNAIFTDNNTWRNLKYINAADTTADLAGTGPGTGYIVYDGGSSSALKTTVSSGYSSISVSPTRVVAVSASQPSLTDLPKGGIWLQLI